jgi:tRNA pseudouridine32 synthase/23S rRNA pseudouridine746 synthase
MLPTRDGVSPSCVATPAGNWRLMLDFLVERIPAVGRDAWQARMSSGDVVDANGHPMGPLEPFVAHRKLYYWRALSFEHPIPFEEGIVFQDDLLVVADKPHFLPVTPKGRYVQQTLLVRLKKRLGLDTLVPIHRIDRETAGLVAFSVRPQDRHAYQGLFRERAVHKVYEAIAPLNPELSLPLRYQSRLQESERFMTMQTVEGEPNAETLIELIAQHQGLWHLRLRPVTGRKHQLRAQLHALGMPICHDQIYPVLKPELPLGMTPDFSQPLQLLARSLAFQDPITGEARQFESRQSLALIQGFQGKTTSSAGQ